MTASSRGQAEHARARIAGLRLRHDAAELDEAEAEGEERVRHLALLVEAGREPDRVRKAAAEAPRPRGADRPRGGAPCGGEGEGPDGRARCAVSGVEGVEQRPREGKERPRSSREVRKDVAPVRAERQRLHPAHGRQRQRAVEMREQRAAARGLVAQGVAERVRVDRDEDEVVVPAKCFAAVSATCAAVEKWMKPSCEVDRRAAKTPASSASRQSGFRDRF